MSLTFSLKKNDFPSLSNNQMCSSCRKRTSWPPGCWDFMAWECESIVHATTINANLYVNYLFCAWKTLFHRSHLPVMALTNFVFFLHRCLSLDEWGVVEMSHLWSNIPVASMTPLITAFSQLLIAVYSRRSFIALGWVLHWSTGRAGSHQETFYWVWILIVRIYQIQFFHEKLIYGIYEILQKSL